MLFVIILSSTLRLEEGLKISANDLPAQDVVNAEQDGEQEDSSQRVIPKDLVSGPSESDVNGQGKEPELTGLDYEEESKIPEDLREQLGERYIRIRKPQGKNLTWRLEDIYITKSIRILIEGSETEMDIDRIARENQGEHFKGEPVCIQTTLLEPEDPEEEPKVIKDYGSDLIHGIMINSISDEQTGTYRIECLLELDHVYVHILLEDDSYYYIGLKNPREIYDKILVIDAGHGGKDAGAVSRNKKIYEKHLNLNMLLYLKEMLDKEDIKVYYTRLGDDKIFLRPRVQLANDLDCDFFISIHCNSSTAKSPNGSEIYYYDKTSKNVKNKDLAKILMDELDKVTDLKKRGVIQYKDDALFILNHALVPAVIVETGYMSNDSDLKYLIKEENQKTIAEGLYNGIMRAYQELEPMVFTFEEESSSRK